MQRPNSRISQILECLDHAGDGGGGLRESQLGLSTLWLVRSAQRLPGGAELVTCTGVSELVRDSEATFLSDLDEIVPLDARETRLVPDNSPGFRRTRLMVEAALRKTPMPLHDGLLHVSHLMLVDPLEYQRRAVVQALASDNRVRRNVTSSGPESRRSADVGYG